jgi:RNA polymerase sigma-70 factor (ECF subfamily)
VPHRAAERVARESYGRLVALIAARTRDVAGAEDAVSAALVEALARWPETGVPANPEGWLVAVARRRAVDGARRSAAAARVGETLAIVLAEAGEPNAPAEVPFPDERLKLLFVCGHPAIDPAARTPLMLQTVLGVDAARIASAFLVSPAAMAQRLVRAKTRIREAGIPFETPEARDLPDRVEAVLGAIYAAFTVAGDAAGADELTREAVWLARTLAALMPEEPEARGLLALLLHAEARRPARRTENGRYVRLSDQDPALWSADLIAEAEFELARAAAARRPGRYQLEAAIQSVHAGRRRTGRTDWGAVAFLYGELRRWTPARGAAVGEAAALLHARGGDAGLAALDAIDARAVAAYQPYWAVRAECLRAAGRADDAEAAYDRAIGLSEDPGVRAFLAEERSRLNRP